jgi:hypothetical protein
MKKKLFTYAVLLHNYDADNKYTDSTLIIEPTTILAKTEADVAFTVTRAIPDKYAQNPDNVEILIKSF